MHYNIILYVLDILYILHIDQLPAIQDMYIVLLRIQHDWVDYFDSARRCSAQYKQRLSGEGRLQSGRFSTNYRITIISYYTECVCVCVFSRQWRRARANNNNIAHSISRLTIILLLLLLYRAARARSPAKTKTSRRRGVINPI